MLQPHGTIGISTAICKIIAGGDLRCAKSGE